MIYNLFIKGGALYFVLYGAYFDGITFMDNIAKYQGGVMSSESCTFRKLRNLIISNNSSPESSVFSLYETYIEVVESSISSSSSLQWMNVGEGTSLYIMQSSMYLTNSLQDTLKKDIQADSLDIQPMFQVIGQLYIYGSYLDLATTAGPFMNILKGSVGLRDCNITLYDQESLEIRFHSRLSSYEVYNVNYIYSNYTISTNIKQIEEGTFIYVI